MMLITVVIAGLGIVDAHADKLDDYVKAKGQKYCSSIPDSNRKSDCEKAQGNAKDFCDETSCQGLSYKDRVSTETSLKDKLTRLDSDVRELESKIRELESKFSSAKTDDDKKRIDDDKKRLVYDRDGKKRDIEQNSRDLDSLQKQINDTKIQIKGRIEKGQRCRNYRLEVQKIFLTAQKDAESDGQSNAEIKKIATENLIPHWTDEGVKHSSAIIEIQNALDKCDERLQGKN